MIRITSKILKILSSKQKIMLVKLVLMMILGGVMESLSVSLIYPLITAVMNENDWNQPWYAQFICRIFHVFSQRDYIIILLVSLIMIFILKNVYLLLEYYVQYSFIAACRFKLQRNLLQVYLRKPYEFYLNVNSGEIIRIISNDTVQAFQLMLGAVSLCTETIISIALSITIFVISPQISIGLFFVLLFELAVIFKVIRPTMRKIGNSGRYHNAMVNKWVLQSIQGIKSIKVAGNENYFLQAYITHAERAVEADRKSQTLSNAPRLMIEAVTIAGVMLIILIMILLGAELAFIVPQLSAFCVAVMRLLPSANRISTAYANLSFYEGALDNIIKVIASVGEMEEEDWADNGSGSAVPQLSFKNYIALKNISYHYPNTEKVVLHELNMEICLGQSVGIIGASGAGKTTLVDILLGLLSPQTGQIFIDSVDINLNKEEWNKHIAYIPQTIFLMDGTIKENVVFGMPSDLVNEEHVWAALRDAQMEKFVRDLPDGLDTSVGEAGIRLSGGQRQRIGIARALFTNAEILVFDEATSALDNETEAAIMDSIEHLRGKKTLIIIAHRLSTIEKCDVLYSVKNGRVERER
ncbi:MAG: ABC transporter ATP-binding protein [Lachnospiraceae bacterium]|nr:ABC transporter ATP-binding protein [Lachnospiraceae bacterium]